MIQSQLIRQTSSRRDFLKGSLATGLLLSGLSATAHAQSTSPKKGGTLRVGIEGAATTDTLDPAHVIGAFAFLLVRTIGDTLVTSDPATGKPLPGIASHWDASNQFKDWVFKIRKDINFHNGKKLTAEDCAQTIRRHMREDSGSGARGMIASIESVEAQGDDLIVKLSESNVDLPLVFTIHLLMIQPNGGFDNPADGIGTGPYRLVSFEPGVRSVLEKNPDDWQTRGFVDSVEMLAMNDATARIAALSSGRVHFINAVNPNTVALLEQAGNVEILNAPSRGHYTLPMLVDTPPFDNNDLRLALKYAIDREAVLQTTLSGYGTIGNDFPINATYPNFPADIEQRLYDPDRAAFHFKKSGHDGPIVLRTSDGTFPGAVDAAILYQETAKKAGIQIDVKREPADGYWNNIWRKVPFCMSYYGSRLTQDLMYATECLSDSPANETNFRRADFDNLIKQARVIEDDAKRAEIYHAAALMVRDEGGSIIPVFNNNLNACLTSVKGYVDDVGNDMSNGFLCSRLWLDS